MELRGWESDGSANSIIYASIKKEKARHAKASGRRGAAPALHRGTY